jgi:hypothetical protein
MSVDTIGEGAPDEVQPEPEWADAHIDREVARLWRSQAPLRIGVALTIALSCLVAGAEARGLFERPSWPRKHDGSSNASRLRCGVLREPEGPPANPGPSRP